MGHYQALKTKHRTLRDDFPQSLSLRVHRALSWLDRAERETDDADAAFIFLWIAFNAAYAQELEGNDSFSQKALFDGFIVRLVDSDQNTRLYQLLWRQFSGPVRTLIANPYVFQPFWDHQLARPTGHDWEERFRRAKVAAHHCLATQDVAKLLQIVLSRLYVLRNQLVHGLATWGGQVNRAQVRDGAAIMGEMVPVLVDLMMDDPRRVWGEACYPVVGGGSDSGGQRIRRA